MMRMSKSRLNQYQTCPYQFKLNYVEGFREDISEPQEGSPLKKGTELHKIFEDYYDLPAAKTVETEEDILNLLLSFPEAKKAHLEESDGQHDNLYHKFTSYQLLEEEYFKHLNNFAAYNYHNLNRYGEDYFPYSREQELYNSEQHFIGIVDRIDRRDGEYVVLDYKTGRPGTLKKYLVELALYKWLVEVEVGVHVSEVGIYFSENGKERTVELDSDDVQEALLILDLTKERIKEEDFPRKRSFLCNFCDHKQLCELDLDF